MFGAPVLEQVVNFTEARHAVLAGNIANLDTPGYRSRDLSPAQFQERLKEAIAVSHAGATDPSAQGMAGGLTGAGAMAAGDASASDAAFKAVADESHTLVYHDDSNVDLEHQALELTKNQMQFNLALTLLTAQFHSLEAAISERP
jgi:flagellar basal-body rod protein FlgB